MRDLSERELVEYCLKNDEAAWRELIRRYEGVVYGVSYRILKDADDARDATQEALIRALRGLDAFEPGRKLKPWLAKIAWNHAIRVAARRQKNLVALSDDGPEGPWSGLPDPAMFAERKEMGKALQQAMNRLPTAMQVVVEMRCLQGMDYREISHATGWPIGTVKTNLFRARRRLVSMLSMKDGDLG